MNHGTRLSLQQMKNATAYLLDGPLRLLALNCGRLWLLGLLLRLLRGGAVVTSRVTIEHAEDVQRAKQRHRNGGGGDGHTRGPPNSTTFPLSASPHIIVGPPAVARFFKRMWSCEGIIIHGR